MLKDDAVRDRGDGGKSEELGDIDEDEDGGVDELSDSEDCDDDDRAAVGSVVVAIEGSHHDAVFE
jgi:hypothetical protein